MLPSLNLPKNGLGKRAEDYASELLISKGYKIIDRNFRSRFGEIDIVAMEGDTLVFAEVKARGNTRFGLPEEAVTPQKLRKIARTGEYFSLTHPTLPKKLRIEVVALNIDDGGTIFSKIIIVEP